ncbi:hypothetical protein Y032_0283g1328 [Ancylostoma ceylanicum]|uniref:Uncharacterized protein n=1 Tax=Ancylostoma ceylanicum TaxID=53326 RepID=A0A016S798_9BILA|nr:hypothetical protein Y032_0283g1328 [Ancylostoma ceylanicum]
MKALRGARQFKKRVAPQLTRPAPLPQFNHFAALCSDDEEQETVPPSQPQPQQISPVEEKDPNWWSDEEDSNETDDCSNEIVRLMEDLMREVCRMGSSDQSSENSDWRDCKDSWSDDE